MMDAPDVNLAVRKSVTVGWAPEEAFRRFTAEINDWWPTETHSVGQDASVQLMFETNEGGRIYERTADGVETDIGTPSDRNHSSRAAQSPFAGRPVSRQMRVFTRRPLRRRGSVLLCRLSSANSERNTSAGPRAPVT